MGKKIYEDNWWYNRLKFLAGFYIRGAFCRLKYTGLDRIPRGGALLYAPNHCNGLMDPLAVVNIDDEKKVFVARADIFDGKKASKFLSFLKMLPINRMRDGFKTVTRAEDTITKCIEVMAHKVSVCILPEGTHRTMHALLPIGKGVARVALGAVKELGSGCPVYIVPAGLEYGDYFRYRSTLLVNVGEPLNVTEYVFSHPELQENDIYRWIRETLGRRLRRSIVCVNDEASYDAIWELTKIASGRRTSDKDLEARYECNASAVKAIEEYSRNSPEEAAALFSEAADFATARRKARISLKSLRSGHLRTKALKDTLVSILEAPFFAASAAASLPVWAAAECIASKSPDPAFRNSFRVVVHVAVWTLMLVIWAAFLFSSQRWYIAAPLLAVLTVAPMVVYDYFERMRITVSNWNALANGSVRERYRHLEDRVKTIVSNKQ